MKRAIALIALIAVCLVSGVHAPSLDASSIACFGAPSAYVAAFDTARGKAADGKVTYNEQRFYVEEQTWATPRLETPGHHSEHIHFGACVPNAQTMKATFPLDLSYTFHNMQDYQVTAASESAVTQAGSDALWLASAAQIDALNTAAQESCATCANPVQSVYFSVMTSAPATNGRKEIRGSVKVVASGPAAVFQSWTNDARWYETDNFAGLPLVSGLGNQAEIRVRPIMAFFKPGTTTLTTDYHHSGWCGMTPPQSASDYTNLPGQGSNVWTRATVNRPWDAKTICLYVTDGGGPATLMIDPDFHHHYTAPTADCPNVDQAGNCLGVWYWQPDNKRKEIFGAAGTANIQYVPVEIPASVLAGLAPGVHHLVFKSDDFPECVRANNFTTWAGCPSDVRGTWTNVSVLPFTVP